MPNKNIESVDSIRTKIFNLREHEVMLDRDLAKFYGVEARRLREQVKRNIHRFPSNFMFQLNDKEIEILVSQNAIPSKKHLGGHNLYAFTEQGVSMLSAVLRSPIAVKISIQIISVFVSMRKFVSKNAEIFLRLDSIERKQ